MTPADIVISRFGGVRPLARQLEKDPSTIHRWKQPKEKGGLEGRIPSSCQMELLRLAGEQGIELCPDDLVMGPDGVAVSYGSKKESTGAEELGDLANEGGQA